VELAIGIIQEIICNSGRLLKADRGVSSFLLSKKGCCDLFIINKTKGKVIRRIKIPALLFH
jgi:hypothetical protein